MGTLDREDDGDDDLEGREAFPTSYFETPGNGESSASALLPKTFGSESLQRRLTELNEEFSDLFRPEVAPQPADLPPMDIVLHDEDPSNPHPSFGKRTPAPRPQSHANQEEIRSQTTMMQRLRVIRPVNLSDQVPHYSQVHLAPKPGSTKKRFCLDFRALNEMTRPHHFPLPHIPTLFERVKHHKVYGKLDATSGFWNIQLTERAQLLTAFVTAFGVFCCLRMPFGLKNSAAYFQQMMSGIILLGLVCIICEVYIDDILIYAKDDDEFISRLRQVYERFRTYKVYLNPAKCQLGMSTIDYLGRTLTENTISVLETKKQQIAAFVRPDTMKGVKRFVGLTTWLCDFIPDFARLAAPLHALTHGYKPGSKIKWTEESISSFDKLKQAVADCQSLYFITEDGEIFLYTDASIVGIGACLMQVVDGVERPIMFYSQKFSERQSRWSTPDQECYAIYRTITRHSYLLQGRRFTIRTDHANLKHLNEPTSQKVYRWKMELQAYDATWEHIPGKDNPADEFSRMFSLLCVLYTRLSATSSKEEAAIVLKETHSAHAAPDNSSPRPTFAPPIDIPDEVFELISKYHNPLVGHFGEKLTFERILTSEKGPFTNLREHVRAFIRICPCCQKMSMLKTPIETYRFTTYAFSPFDEIAVDHNGPFPKDVYGNEYILVIIDSFSRYLQLYPVPDVSAETTARFFNIHFGRFGAPLRIRSDRGSAFVNDLITEFLALIGTQHCLTIAYSKEENGLVERSNKEINRHLRAIIFDRNIITNWSTNIPLVERIYNSKKNLLTGVTPASIIFGNAVHLDKGLFLPHTTDGHPTMTLSQWQSRMLSEQARIIEVVEERLNDAHTRHMAKQSATPTFFPDGSFVLLNYPNAPPTKFHLAHAGPYKVISSNKNKYVLQNLVTTKTFDVALSRLSPFHYNPERTDPLQVALKDDQHFIIKAIHGHRGNHRVRSTLEFQVEWVGYPYDPTQWQPWVNIRKGSDVLRNYLLQHKELRYIAKPEKTDKATKK